MSDKPKAKDWPKAWNVEAQGFPPGWSALAAVAHHLPDEATMEKEYPGITKQPLKHMVQTGKGYAIPTPSAAVQMTVGQPYNLREKGPTVPPVTIPVGKQGPKVEVGMPYNMREVGPTVPGLTLPVGHKEDFPSLMELGGGKSAAPGQHAEGPGGDWVSRIFGKAGEVKMSPKQLIPSYGGGGKQLSEESRKVLGQMRPDARPGTEELTPAGDERTMKVLNNFKARKALEAAGADPDAEYGSA